MRYGETVFYIMQSLLCFLSGGLFEGREGGEEANKNISVQAAANRTSWGFNR